MATVKDLRALALAPHAGFRFKAITVPEWEGVEIVLREPSAESWMRWRELARLEVDDEAEDLGIAERAQRSLAADVTLFLDVVCDADKKPVFSLDDAEAIAAIYGPVHSRLLKQALDLITSADEAKKN